MDWVIVPTKHLEKGDVVRPINARGPFSLVTKVTEKTVTVEPVVIGGVDEDASSRLPRKDGCENTFERGKGYVIPRMVL